MTLQQYLADAPIAETETPMVGDLCFLNGHAIVRVREIQGTTCFIEYPSIGYESSCRMQNLQVIDRAPAERKGLSLVSRRSELIDNIARAIDATRPYSDEWRALYRLYQIVGADSSSVPHWFAMSMATSIDDSRQCSWASEPRFFDDDKRRRRGRPKVLLQVINRMANETIFTPEMIDKITYVLGETTVPRDEYVLRVIEGDELYAHYQDGTGPHSCMVGTSYVRMYATNHPVCRMLAIYRAGRFFGRALLWQTDQGVTVLDRIYPNSGVHVGMAIQYAESQGWDYLDRQTYGQDRFHSGNSYTVTIPRGYKRWPYLDTFRFSRTHDITNGPVTLYQRYNEYEPYHFLFDGTKGTPTHNTSFCAETDPGYTYRYTYCPWGEWNRY